MAADPPAPDARRAVADLGPDESAERFHALLARLFHGGERPTDGRPMGPIEELFWDGDGPSVHKFLHYLPLYDRYFGPLRGGLAPGRPIRFLEIGVFGGGSLWMWRRFFGSDAVIVGVDVDPGCAALDGRDARVRIGSQDDPAFLAAVVEEMGGLDVVLDDGSHEARHVRASLNALFPRLSEGGLYVIEDLCAAYWPHYGGGHGRPDGLMADLKAMIDDMHHWYHDRGEAVAATAGALAGLHLHDSMAVLEKRRVGPPRHAVRRPGLRYA